ncbi:MAG: iron-sulfur cluster assembly scaffold protein [Oceanicaulis sp.]
MTDVYTTDLLKLAADIPHAERLANPQASASKVSRICGSALTLDLMFDAEGRIADLGMDVSACALGQASASVFARNALGATRAEIAAARDQLKAMLQAGGPAPDGRFAELTLLKPAASYRQRHGSILLAFDAACEAMGPGRP